MAAVLGTTAGAVSNEAMNWHDIEWEKVQRNVRRLQARIVQATQITVGKPRLVPQGV